MTFLSLEKYLLRIFEINDSLIKQPWWIEDISKFYSTHVSNLKLKMRHDQKLKVKEKIGKKKLIQGKKKIIYNTD